jgi:hypothetical protein
MSSLGISSSAQISTGSASSNSANAGESGGCCFAVAALLVLLGFGLAGEFYQANMHIYDQEGDKYEQYLQKEIEENVEKLKMYLATHKKKFEALKAGAGGDELDPDLTRPAAKLLEIPLDYEKILSQVVPDPKAGEAQKKQDELAKKREQLKKNPDDKQTKKEVMIENAAESIKAISPGILMFFYAGYSAVPTVISKHFSFYALLMIVAVALMSAPGSSA